MIFSIFRFFCTLGFQILYIYMYMNEINKCNIVLFWSLRHAIEVNKRDYRAWYGLGQTYEILKMPFYSLYYYRKAHQLR